MGCCAVARVRSRCRVERFGREGLWSERTMYKKKKLAVKKHRKNRERLKRKVRELKAKAKTAQ